MGRFLAGAMALGAVACSHPVTTTPEFVWHCAGGSSFSVRFNDPDAAVVSVADRVHVLPIARSASGARYSDGTVEYWEHQGQATLSGVAGGPYGNCRAR